MNCVICLSEVAVPYCELDCTHVFCQKCIQKWCEEHSKCPVCNSELGKASLVTEEDSKKELVLKPGTSQPVQSLDCLDHSYFRNELGKLSRLAYDIEIRRFKQRNSPGQPHEWKLLRALSERIQTLTEQNQNYVQFNPEELLTEVYELDSKLKMVMNGNVPPELVPEPEPLEIDSDEDYEYY